VQGYHQLADGSWTGPLDWKGEDEIEFCRDDADQDVRRIAILYGNSEIAGRMSGDYEVEVRDTCPQTFDVTLDWLSDAQVMTDTQWTIEGTLEPPTRRTPSGRAHRRRGSSASDGTQGPRPRLVPLTMTRSRHRAQSAYTGSSRLTEVRGLPSSPANQHLSSAYSHCLP
jgi:hypothetical protein